MKIILVGYMASGKTTVGKCISEELQIPFSDLDVLIEMKTNLKINEIFNQKGELFFRKIEREVLIHFLQSTKAFVLALGGGTPCYYDNYKLYENASIHTFYLKASIETLRNRLLSEKFSRPLLSHFSTDELLEFVAKHLFERSFYYNQVKKIVSIDNKNQSEIVSEIVSDLA